MANDFHEERKWKMSLARKVSRLVNRHFAQLQRAKEKEEQVRKPTALFVQYMCFYFYFCFTTLIDCFFQILLL